MPDIQNAVDYAAYECSVADFITREGISFLSTSTEEMDNLGADEPVNVDPWFSWRPCECCGSDLGGNREYLYARDAEGSIVQYEICEDCVYYVNYGRLDDSTMLRVKGLKINP